MIHSLQTIALKHHAFFISAGFDFTVSSVLTADNINDLQEE